ncbi:hypothetical protein EMCRGX_G030453 [Ephydatia muelleri]
MRARLHRQNESMDSLRAGQLKAKEADKAKTEMRRELAEQMQKFKAEVMKQKDKEMDELRATLLKKEQERQSRDDPKTAREIEQLKIEVMKIPLYFEPQPALMKDKGKEKWKGREREIGKLRSELAIERDREVKSLKTKIMEENQKEKY